MIRVFGETLSAPSTASRVAGNRPPLAPLPVSLSIRHSDELACGAGLLTRAACAGSHLRAGKPARESRCAPTAYAVVSDCVAAVRVSRHAPLTRCRHTDVISYPPVMHCATTAFAVGASAHPVFANHLACQRHTTMLHAIYEPCCTPTGFRACNLTALRAASSPLWRGAPQAGEPAGHRLGRAPRAVGF